MKKNIFVILAVFFWVVSLMGCNMVKGTGQDIEGAGKSIQGAADANK